ncbi:T6SS immunity protein Tli4 family protein [Caldimonas caldifontis]|uniref:Tle cognate immunity protein 4 C-terminal domain-containing protein n=1 Tax=Caldimonas caldifontis TaxID=1452508 RepID=A0A2S5SQ87_9BURK|nr:T6SS immunity protein Tli4 family protein [Caldimonas caldifontis]PPE64869.1 hypothetical protein C1704_17315 [Caldimonas caldifontis]
MTAEEAQLVQKLTARMRTRCIGRHLIDLPEDFVLNPVDGVQIEGVEVSMRPLPRAVFDYQLERRTEELKNQVINMLNKTPVLMDVRNVPGGVGKVFNRANSYAFARIWELMDWQDGFLITASVKAFDYSLDKPLGNEPTDSSDVEEKYTHLLNVYRRLRGRRDDEIPSEPGDCFAHGFHLLNVYRRLRGRRDDEIPSEPGDCFAHGFLRGGPLEDVAITAFYHLKDAPDVFVMFSHSTQVWEDDTMLQRASSIERQLAAAGIKTLRKGPRTIHGLPYEEWLSREPETVTSARVPGHGLTLHGNEAAKDPRKPNIEFTLYNGHYIPSPPRSLEEKAMIPDLTHATLSEGQVLALWEAITATLRPRPGAL